MSEEELRELTEDEIFDFFSEGLVPHLAREDGRRFTSSKEVCEVILKAVAAGCRAVHGKGKHPALLLPEGKTTPQGKSYIPFPSTTKNWNAGKNLLSKLRAAGVEV